MVREQCGPFLIEEVELDEPRDDEVLVRIVGTGLCHTDLGSKAGKRPTPFPIVLGHEGAGVVEKVGSRVRKVQPGDHVVLTFYFCGKCVSCEKGEPTNCANFVAGNFIGKRMDGTHTITKDGEPISAVYFGQSSFASHSIVNEQNVIKVDKGVPLDILGPLGCGVQTGAGGVLNSLHPKAGSSIAVFGTGSVGMSAILAAAACGCTTIVAVDVKEERLKKALELGATHAINSGSTDPVEKIKEITGGGIEYSLDCTGIADVIKQAIYSLKAGGKCGLIGLPDFGVEVSLIIGVLLHCTVLGITEGDSVPDVFIPQMVDLYKRGKFPIDKLVTFYPLEKINDAVTDSESGKTLKAVLRP